MMRRWIIAGMVLLGGTTACELSRSAQLPDCASTADCNPGKVCFFAKCVDPGYNIASVYVDVVPPTSSGLLPQGDTSARDVSGQAAQIISLRPTLHIRGAMASADASSPAPAGTLTATPQRDAQQPALPSLQLAPSATLDGTGFELDVVPGFYDLQFSPNGIDNLPPIDLGARYYGTDWSGTEALTYPATTSLVKVSGRVLYDASLTQGGGPDGVLVEGQANVGTAPIPLSSTTATTTNSGTFTLEFPPGAQTFTITVRPSQANAQVPHATFDNVAVTSTAADGTLQLGDMSLDLPLPENTSFNGVVRSTDGQAVPQATVLFQGNVGAGSYSVSANSAANGAISVNDLLPGTYDVTVAPLATQPYGLGTGSVCIPASGDPTTCPQGTSPTQPVEFTVSNKITVSGDVVSASGTPVAAASLSLVRLGDGPPREFAATTDSGGHFAVAVDPAPTAAASDIVEYEVTVEPPRESGLPRHREIVRVGTADTQVHLQLYEASLVHGQVLDPGGRPLPDVVIAFYSVELGSLDRPLLVGLGQSDAHGEFVIPVPTPRQP